MRFLMSLGIIILTTLIGGCCRPQVALPPRPVLSGSATVDLVEIWNNYVLIIEAQRRK